MPGGAVGNGHRAIRIRPAVSLHLAFRSAVVHLPEGQGVGAVIELELFVKIAVHGADDQRIPLGHHGRGAKKGLLLRVGMLGREGIVLADNANGGIDAVPRLHNLVRQACAVAVADHIRTPLFRKLQGQLLIAGLSGKGKAALAVFLIHRSFLRVRRACFHGPSAVYAPLYHGQFVRDNRKLTINHRIPTNSQSGQNMLQ